MLTEKRVETLNTLYRQGMSIRAISGVMGIPRSVVRSYLSPDEDRSEHDMQSEVHANLDRFKSYIRERLAASPNSVPVTVIDREIRAQGYQGGVNLLRSYMAELKATGKPVASKRLKTGTGTQVRADWHMLRQNMNDKDQSYWLSRMVESENVLASGHGIDK